MIKSDFQFVRPFIIYSKFQNNIDFKDKNDSMKMSNNFNVRIDRFKSNKKANVYLTLKVNDNNENAPFVLDIQVASTFSWDNLESDTVDNMLKINAPAFLLSYMRPIVAELTSTSPTGAYYLPFFNFTK